MNALALANQTALVTGASGGLGADFARQLAARGANVILTARRAEQLRAVAAEIAAAYPVSTQVVPLDLAAPDAPETLYRQLHEQGKRVDVLVNNAGFGLYGDFAAVAWEKEREMLMLDMITLTALTRLFLADMLARNSGYILQVASIGAYQPSPSYAAYSAAKAYVLNLGEALAYELRRTGVSVTVVSPGVTATEFLKVAGQSPSLYQRLMMMDSPSVARIGIEAMLRRRPSVVPGFMNALAVFALRLLPRRTQAALANWTMNRY